MEMRLFWIFAVQFCTSIKGEQIVDSICDGKATDTCFTNLDTFLALDKLQFTTNEHELENMCTNSEEGVRCSEAILKSGKCVTPVVEMKVKTRIEASKEVHSLICRTNGKINNEKFRTAYLNHSECIKKYSKFGSCYKGAGMPHDVRMIIVDNSTQSQNETYLRACCPVEKFLSCSRKPILANCGNVTLETMATYINATLGKTMYNFCTACDPVYPSLSTTCEQYTSAAVHQCQPSVVFVVLTAVSAMTMFATQMKTC